MLKELCCTAMLLTAGANLYAQEPQSIEKSQTIVYINGAKYYVHNVRHGETLYSLAKTYGVAEHPQLAQGLKADQSLKIPVVETGVVVQEQLSPKKLKKTFDQHTVQKGETLYGISKRYAISVETIMEDNPGLDPIHLKPGSVILIRKRSGKHGGLGAVQGSPEPGCRGGLYVPHRRSRGDDVRAVPSLRYDG